MEVKFRCYGTEFTGDSEMNPPKTSVPHPRGAGTRGRGLGKPPFKEKTKKNKSGELQEMLEVKTNRRVSGNGILIFFRITDSLLKVRMLELNGAASTGRNTPKTPTGGAEPVQVILEIRESQSDRLLSFLRALSGH